ncbi:GNAT family protein [Desulfosporosinus sp. PR]|uniref:GNAT family N-acetyltransferase n=1 Tax=Candidatus Desulfosporosinus nitrosoreducens TaxID=3401928 RepID=UPI0027EB8EBD|nr:GNAT family protein [Desulfosporosinus sp. PR]MDQ7096614.1 GNAT family protein [Desulfosporosinus sp. PR]
MPRILGERIILREYRKEDIEHMRKWVNDPEVVDFLSDIFLFPHTINITEDFVNSVLKGEHKDSCNLIIAKKDTEEYLGQIDLIYIDWKNRAGEIGIVLGAAENRGKGYGTEAIKLLQRYVFNRLNLNRLEIKVRDFNIRALRCYIKCGFKEEGRLRQNFFVNGNYTDTIVLSLLKSEYEMF